MIFSLLVGCNVYDGELLTRQLTDSNLAAGSGSQSGATAGRGGSPAAAGKGGASGGSGAGGAAGRGRAGTGGVSAAGRGGSSGAPNGAAADGGDSNAAEGGSSAGAGTAGTEGTAGAAGTAASGACSVSDAVDCCPDDPNKQEPGTCGCGVADSDSDGDSVLDCKDDAPFGWQRKLTLDGAQVADTLTDFPLLVRVTDDQLKSTAAMDGSDIYFVAADKTTLLDFEIESYAADSGGLVAWVRVPSLISGMDAILYLGYDDGRSGRGKPSGVWSGYKHVWHLAENPNGGSGAVKDATGRSHGTAQGGLDASSLVGAVAGSGLRFDGKDDAVTFTNDVTGSGPSTLSGWVNQAADSGDNGASIISFGSGVSNQSRFLLAVAEQQKLKVGFYGNDKQPDTVLPHGTWKHVVWVWTGSQSTVYVDGAVVSGPVAHTGANTSGSMGSIGGSTFGYPFFMTGQLDEVRVSTDARSAAWIKTEFNSQKPGATFIKTIGEAQAAPSH